MRIDARELAFLGLELASLSASARSALEPVVKRGAQNIKDDMVAEANASTHFRQVAHTISYDRTADPGVFYEIGPDRERGGGAGLAGAYLGWPDGGGATLSLDAPVEAEAPRFEEAVNKYVLDAL